MEEIIILLGILAVVILVSQVVGRYRAKSIYESIEKHNEAVQKLLVDLTEQMRVYSEESTAEFELWANLNDALLEAITDYCNSTKKPRDQILSEADRYVAQVYERLARITSSGNESDLLLSYAKEVKSNKLSQQDAASGASA